MEKYLVIIIILVFRSCSTNPRAINYNTDNCSYCKMTIVDQIHATELVTEKGRIKVYDAIECMLYDLKENPSVVYQHYKVNTYNAPKILEDASTSVYLISEELPSPMGANLTAFKDSLSALNVQKEIGGTLYSWSKLKQKFNL